MFYEKNSLTDDSICAKLIKLNETLPKTAGAARRNDFPPAEEMRFDFSASLSVGREVSF